MAKPDIRANGVGQAFYVELDPKILPEWILRDDGTHWMNLEGGFARRGPTGMYAERTISPEDARDLSELYGIPPSKQDVRVKYDAPQQKLIFEFPDDNFVLDGTNPEERANYLEALWYLFENDALVGLAGGTRKHVTGRMAKNQNEHSIGFKAAAVGVAVFVAGVGALYAIGEPTDDRTTNTNTDQSAPENSQHVVATDTPDSSDSSGEVVQDANMPDWLIKEKGLFGLGDVTYKIDRGKLPFEGAGFELVEGNDDNFDDGSIRPYDGNREMMTGIDAKTNKIFLVVDEDLFHKDGPSGPAARFDEHRFSLNEDDFTKLAPGIYYNSYDLGDKREICFVGKKVANHIEEFEILPAIVYKRPVQN